MLATFLALAAEVAEEETSKTLFYVAGGVLAAWAVILFAIGMRSPDFPGSKGAQRGVMAVSALLVLLTAASSIVTA